MKLFRDLSTDNLRYLNSEQALEDLANFRLFIHGKYFLTDANKWIVFGGSYPGNLAAWTRLKYPHLFYGAVSSSAPVLAKADFMEYYSVVNQSLYRYSPKCVEAIQDAIDSLGSYLRFAKEIIETKFR